MASSAHPVAAVDVQGLGDHIVGLCRCQEHSRAGVVRRRLIEAQLSAAICELVIAGAGLALIDPITAFEMRDRGLAATRFEPRIEYPLSLLFPSYRARAATLEAFLRILHRELAKNPWIA